MNAAPPLVLTSGDASATIDSAHGGKVTSIRAGHREILAATRPIDGLPPEWFNGSFSMVPYAGVAIRDACLQFGGRSLPLEANAGRHAGHGVAYGRPWAVREALADTVTMEFDLAPWWPFGGRAEHRITLEPSALRMDLTLHAGPQATPYILGFHPWFPAAGVVLDFEPTVYFAPDEDSGLPSLPRQGRPPHPWDHVFGQVESAPVLRYTDGLNVRVDSDAEAWIICERPGAVAVEPLTAPSPTLGRAVLPAHDHATLTCAISWGASLA